MATAEQNMETSRRVLEEIPAMRHQDFRFLEEVASPDHVLHDPSAPDPEPGLNATKSHFQAYAVAFPDLRFVIQDAFASENGNRVVTHWIMEGTNSGPMQGMPATGNSIAVEGMTIDHYDGNGILVETWNVFDTLGLVEQLGAFRRYDQANREARLDVH